LFAAYDVISVKPSHPDRIINTAVFHHPDGIDGESVTVEMIVRSSYVSTFGVGSGNFVNQDVIAGLPAWAKNDTFALQAKMGPEQMAAFAKLDKDQQRACQDNMGKAMLVDRFKFKMHREPKQVPAYELVVAKGGQKLKEITGPDPNAPIGPDGKPQTMSVTRRPAYKSPALALRSYSMSMEDLADFLGYASGVNHSVIDKTGLTGRYSFILTFDSLQGMGPTGGPTNAAPDAPGLSILTAIEDQLGLRLERTTTTFDAVVVDHVERPSSN
jgi:uncharacterized protein (TIGR03435 family)